MEPFLAVPRDILRRTDLSPGAKLVYASLVDLVRFLGPAIGTRKLAESVGIHRSKLLRAIAELERAGLIAVDRDHKGEGRIARNRYIIARAYGLKTCPLAVPITAECDAESA